MKRANIYIFNIGNAWATSGVDRYLEVFSTGFPSDGEFGIYKISLMKDNSHILHTREERNGCMEITIPFPMDSDEVINERYWMRKYNQYVFYLIKDIFEKDVVSVLHIHTLNLIDLAQWIKSQVPLCKIITHLHCIPWKNIFNKNKRKFNKLYCANYLSGKKDWNKNQFLTNNCELDSYIASDKIITVTDCAREFLSRIMEIPEHKITIISNGLYDKNKDSYIRQFKKNTSDTFHCVYVGVLSESKGILYILQSLRKVREKGYKVTLYIAGGYSSSVKSFIEKNFKDLSLEILGRISFEELQHYYKESDIGIIASLQEQCSYVAIEMAMFGLPIVTTAVDGLDEMFTDGVNALKVNTRFSKVFGLSVDTDSLAEKIITLIENGELRQRLSANVRQLYKERFNLETMMQQTLAVYRKLSGHFEEVQQTKKKSLLFCIDSLNSGGAEKLLLNIIECMDYDRCDIDLLIIHEHGVYFKDIPEQVNWFTLKEADSYLFKKYDVEIAFQEGYSTKHIAHRNSGALKIAWVHCDFSSFHWTTGFYKDNAEEQWCYSQLDKIVFVSGQTLKSFNHLFPDIQTVKQVIHNPINREEILAASQSAIIQKDKLTLCCMGRLIECKGYLRLIPILSKLKKDGLDFECWIIGEGKQKQEIDELIQQHSLEQTVLMKGFYSNPYPYLAASDLFVSASFTEGYSLAICEALCLGKPMLVTEVSGAKEIVGDCGLIVPQDEQSIYEGLRKLIEDKNLREGLSKKAFSRSKSIFDYRKNMQEILELLKNEMSYE